MHSPSFPEGDATCNTFFVHVASPSGNEGECNREDEKSDESDSDEEFDEKFDSDEEFDEKSDL